MVRVWRRCRKQPVILLSQVGRPVGRIDRTMDLHVACMAALCAIVVGCLTGVRKVPEVAVMAKCCLENWKSASCFEQQSRLHQ